MGVHMSWTAPSHLRPLQPSVASCVHGDSLGKNTGVGCHAHLQGIFPTQGLNPRLFMSLALAGRFFTTSTNWEALWILITLLNILNILWELFLETNSFILNCYHLVMGVCLFWWRIHRSLVRLWAELLQAGDGGKRVYTHTHTHAHIHRHPHQQVLFKR